jgi:hypothetical protein
MKKQSKSEAAAILARLRWRGTSAAYRSAHGRMMASRRLRDKPRGNCEKK